MTSTTTTSLSTTTRQAASRRRGPGPGALSSASTPNLSQLHSSHSAAPSRLAYPSLSRKPSFPALTQSSLASIPDDTEAYAASALTEDKKMPAPLTPGRPGAGEGLTIGDAVDVPGNMYGTVRFIGSVAGRKGTFAGVELAPDFAARGKNSGDVDG